MLSLSDDQMEQDKLLLRLNMEFQSNTQILTELIENQETITPKELSDLASQLVLTFPLPTGKDEKDEDGKVIVTEDDEELALHREINLTTIAKILKYEKNGDQEGGLRLLTLRLGNCVANLVEVCFLIYEEYHKEGAKNCYTQEFWNNHEANPLCQEALGFVEEIRLFLELQSEVPNNPTIFNIKSRLTVGKGFFILIVMRFILPLRMPDEGEDDPGPEEEIPTIVVVDPVWLTLLEKPKVNKVKGENSQKKMIKNNEQSKNSTKTMVKNNEQSSDLTYGIFSRLESPIRSWMSYKNDCGKQMARSKENQFHVMAIAVKSLDSAFETLCRKSKTKTEDWEAYFLSSSQDFKKPESWSSLSLTPERLLFDKYYKERFNYKKEVLGLIQKQQEHGNTVHGKFFIDYLHLVLSTLPPGANWK